MVAPYNPPVKNQDFKVRIALNAAGDSKSFQVNPTIAAGDFKIDKDGAGFNNLTTLPSVSPVGGVSVLIELSATEMNADVITIVGIDQTATKEWADFQMCILTTA